MALVLQEQYVWTIVESACSTATTVASNDTSGTGGQHARAFRAEILMTSDQPDNLVCFVMKCGTPKSCGTTNNLFLRRTFSKIQMNHSKSMLIHISKVKMVARQLEADGITEKQMNVIMTLLRSLSKNAELWLLIKAELRH